MVGRNLLYLSWTIATLVWCRCLHIPSILACESLEAIRAERREVVVGAWFFGGWALCTLELLYDAQSLMAFIVAVAVTAVATVTALDYIQLLRWVDRVCREGRDMRRSGTAPPLF
jgi:hypothetical protein